MLSFSLFRSEERPEYAVLKSKSALFYAKVLASVSPRICKKAHLLFRVGEFKELFNESRKIGDLVRDDG